MSKSCHWIKFATGSLLTFIIYSPTHSFILDLLPQSKIRDNISREQWAIQVSDEPAVARKMYHHEIESLIVHLFGKSDKEVRIFGLREVKLRLSMRWQLRFSVTIEA